MERFVFNTMFLGLSIETLNTSEIFGLAGGVSYMFESNEGKRCIKRIGDMSYINERKGLVSDLLCFIMYLQIQV